MISTDASAPIVVFYECSGRSSNLAAGYDVGAPVSGSGKHILDVGKTGGLPAIRNIDVGESVQSSSTLAKNV